MDGWRKQGRSEDNGKRRDARDGVEGDEVVRWDMRTVTESARVGDGPEEMRTRGVRRRRRGRVGGGARRKLDRKEREERESGG